VTYEDWVATKKSFSTVAVTTGSAPSARACATGVVGGEPPIPAEGENDSTAGKRP
jgi:hypothetical protein